MSLAPCVAYDNQQDGNDYVMTEMKMSTDDSTQGNDIGEPDIMTMSSNSRPNAPLTEFTTRNVKTAVANHAIRTIPFPQSSQTQGPSAAEVNDIINHQRAAEVTDSSDSSGATDGGTRNFFGSSPSQNNENYPMNNISPHHVHTNISNRQQQPPLSINTVNTTQTNDAQERDSSSQQNLQTKSFQGKTITATISCWSKVPQRKETVLRRLSETLIRGSLTLIDLSQRNLGPNDARLIRLALVHNRSLSVLKLGYNHLGDEGIIVIASAIHGHSHLSVLDVGFNCIGDVGCSALATDAVANNYVLHTLYLSGNTLGENGAFALSQAMIGDIGGGGARPLEKVNPPGCGLRCLHLTANSIKANGVKALTRAITISESKIQERYHLQVSAAGQDSNSYQTRTVQFDGFGNNNRVKPIRTSESLGCRLEELFLGGTDMKSVGCLAVSNMMLTNFSLRVLSLCHNGITDKDLTLFSQSLSRNKSVPIEVLQLSFNQLTCVGVESLMNVVWGSQTLKDLRLDNNKIRDRGAQLVAVVLTSVNLERVNLGFNVITTVGIKALMKSLAENETLQSLTLSGNTLDTSASKAVSYALAYNKHLSSLYLDNCSVGYAAQRHIAAGVASNSSSSLRTLTGFRIGAIAVTLGLPPALENWANDQVLGFFRLMWEKWRKEKMLGAENLGDQQMASSVSLPVGNARNSPDNKNIRGSTVSLSGEQTNTIVKKNGPMDPNTVVMVAKTTYNNLGKDNSALLHWQNNHREVSLQSPLAPNDEMILETTPTGVTRIPPANMFSHNTKLNAVGHGSKEENAMNGQTFSFPLENEEEKTMQVDPKNKDKLMHWLQQHASELNEVTQYPFDNADMWKLHQHFFSPVYNAEPRIKPEISPENGTNSAPTGDTPMAPPQASEANQNHSRRPSILLPPSTNTTTQSSLGNSRPTLGRKTSYHSLSDSIITIPQNNPLQNYQQPRSPNTTRRHSEMYGDSSPVTQPAQKRAKRARISYFPRVKTKLEILRTKTSEHQALVLMRQLKYIENAMLNDNIFQADSGGFTIEDAESILMDML